MLYIAGRLLNLLERARAITLSPAAAAAFPPGALHDGYADLICKFGANSASPTTTIDLAMTDQNNADNANFDTWNAGAPTSWAVTTTGTGTVVETTTGGEVRSGSAPKMNKGTGTARVTKTYRVRAGERLSFSLWLRIAGAGQAKAQLYNPITKKYLTSGFLWQSAQAYFATEIASTSYIEKTGDFTVESFSTCQDAITYLELTVEDTGTGGGSDFAFVDDVFMWPNWNALVVSGHNIEPGMAPELRSSTDNFGSVNTLEATPAVRQPSFFAVLSVASTRRYARITYSGVQSAQAGAVWSGEVAVCYLETALRGMSGGETGYQLRFLPDNIMTSAPGGKVIASRSAQQRRRVLSCRVRSTSDASWREQRDEITGRCHGALWPIVFVPVDTEDVVLHGRLDESWQAQRLLPSLFDDDLVISDNPFPRVT